VSSTLLIVLGVVILATVYWIFKKGLKLLAIALILAGIFAVLSGVVTL
jgi:hypothetical protein